MIWRVIVSVTLTALALAEASARLFGAVAGAGRAPRWPWFVIWIAGAAVVLVGMLERRAAVFGRVFWRGAPDRPLIALTFDDGPSGRDTAAILDTLGAHGVKATFFVLGVNAERHPDLVTRAAREGHEVGNHGFDHRVLPLVWPSVVRDQIARTSVLITRLTGLRPSLFRASHGWRGPWVNRAAAEQGCRVVGWTLGVWDTDRPGADVIVRRTLAGAGSGCVVLLHDGRGVEPEPDATQVVQALPSIIRGLRARGFELVTLSTLIRETEASSGR
jgi:peptidoglycan/xylan/chitin deacetylase (PgdA/CDA1 family)